MTDSNYLKEIKRLHDISQQPCYRCDMDHEYEPCSCCDSIDAMTALREMDAIGWLISKVSLIMDKES